MNYPYKIYCLTSDKYIQAIRPLAWLMDKHWPEHPDVVVGGFTRPEFEMPHRFHFHSIGKFADYPVQRWSDSLIKMIKDIGDDVFMLMLEDMWPIRRVHHGVIQMACDYMHQFNYVARFDLTGDRLHAGGVKFYGKLGDADIVWSDPDSQYHLSMMPALWRKDLLLQALMPNETPWQVELDGTPRLSAMRDRAIVLGTNVWPYKNTLAFRGGDISKLILDDIPEADEMRALGLFEGLE